MAGGRGGRRRAGSCRRAEGEGTLSWTRVCTRGSGAAAGGGRSQEGHSDWGKLMSICRERAWAGDRPRVGAQALEQD